MEDQNHRAKPQNNTNTIKQASAKNSTHQKTALTTTTETTELQQESRNVQWLQTIRLYWANKTINYSVLILVTLLGVVVPCWYKHETALIIPLTLGVIAAALAESDDNFTGRMKSVFITFCCFAMASFSVTHLFEYPPLFALGLFVSTFGFIMLGALGAKYASIAFGSLLIAVYTMLGAKQNPTLWFQPVMLLSGAAWYYFMSMIWKIIWPSQPVQQSLATLFANLAGNLSLKAELFHPFNNLNPQPLRIKEANQNADTVAALNTCRDILLKSSGRGHINSASNRFLTIYFIAQDIHERVSSTHYRYQDLANAFNRSDILFRFQYLMNVQAKICADIARAIRLGTPYQPTEEATVALDELKGSLTHLKEQKTAENKPLIGQLSYLLNNLLMINSQLANINNPAARTPEENTLRDSDPHTLKTMWQRVISHFNFESLLFRHAIRLSIALVLGYGIVQGFKLDKGYWILLTTLFVCQPNYSATRKKLTDRIIGTVAGLVGGAFLLTLFPSQESQLVFIVISGVMFFAFRINNYGFATGFITLLVLFCFNQLGEGYHVLLPRLADTLIGCIIAVGVVILILPDWHSRRLYKILASSVTANKQYLSHIISQYLTGKNDTLDYRIARRAAHNQDADLSVTIRNMLLEPGRYRIATEESFRFLTLNHAMLSYISALGAHRTKLEGEALQQLVIDSHIIIEHHLEMLTQRLNNPDQENDITAWQNSELEKRLNEWQEESESSARMVLQQLQLINKVLPELYSLARKLAAQVEKKEKNQTKVKTKEQNTK